MITAQFQSISKHLLTHAVATYITDGSTSLASYYTCTNLVKLHYVCAWLVEALQPVWPWP